MRAGSWGEGQGSAGAGGILAAPTHACWRGACRCAAISLLVLNPCRDVLRRMLADEASIRGINRQLARLAPGAPTDALARRQFGG